jgi:signal transduction histidine kinase
VKFSTMKKLSFMIEEGILKKRSTLDRYRIALVSSSFSLLLTLLPHYWQWHVPFSVNLSVNLAASVLSALCGGMGPAVSATVISTLGIDFFVEAPIVGFKFITIGVVHNINFILTATLFNFLLSRLRFFYRKTNQAMRAAEKSKRFMDDLIAVVSHDLKTPLTSIGLRAALLVRAPAISLSESLVRKQAEGIIITVKNMEQLINRHLDLEKIKTGRLLTANLKIENVDELLREVISLMEFPASQKSVTLNYSTELPNLAVKCDRVRITQVFSNLIENAIKFSSACGSILIEVGVCSVMICDA